MDAKFQPATALREHMLAGHPVSSLEAMLLFGVRNPTAELARVRRDGFLVKSKTVPMAKIIKRINEYTLCRVPSELPYREIQLTEYWISR